MQVKEPPQPKLPKQLGDRLTFFDLDELEVARQLTYQMWTLFQKIKARTVLPLRSYISSDASGSRANSSGPRGRSRSCTNNARTSLPSSTPSIASANGLLPPSSARRKSVTGTLQQQQQQQQTCADICVCIYDASRSKLLEKLIRVAAHLREMHNFHSLMALVSGINNSAVLRLKWTREKLPSKVKKTLQVRTARAWWRSGRTELTRDRSSRQSSPWRARTACTGS